MQMLVPHKTYLVKYLVISSLHKEQLQGIDSHCHDANTVDMFGYFEKDINLMDPLLHV